jgi:phosphoribosylaminoimidazole-succinocarboxamide synthase
MLAHDELIAAIPHCLQSVDLPRLGPRQAGKVRDIYARDGSHILITTDRISAFDRMLGVVPYKGQVLNQLSAWWFEQTRDIVANHMEAVPDPNVMVVRRAAPLPVEVIVRGYISGVTSTSLWRLYEQGERRPYGVPLPEGMRKNDPLPTPIITPTTKAAAGSHDQQLTRDTIIREGIVSAEVWQQVEAAALALFARGQRLAQRAGLLLVDTKYEFGLLDGQLVLIDEVLTPDSSRFWTEVSYTAAHDEREPDNFDKEFVRLWYVSQGYRGEGEPPALPPDTVAHAAARYISAYEWLTGSAFVPGEQPAAVRIARSLEPFWKQERASDDTLE